ncbi:hypothetical protein AB4225_06245 [Streptomyces sp. 2RAF24]|uniref:hypothetical protein n=1 Tax=Streptomyces sp. 2RAF24 TaxID=3232997 RepID=UPI003F97953E
MINRPYTDQPAYAQLRKMVSMATADSWTAPSIVDERTQRLYDAILAEARIRGAARQAGEQPAARRAALGVTSEQALAGAAALSAALHAAQPSGAILESAGQPDAGRQDAQSRNCADPAGCHSVIPCQQPCGRDMLDEVAAQVRANANRQRAAAFREAADAIDSAFPGFGIDRYVRHGADLLRRLAAGAKS